MQKLTNFFIVFSFLLSIEEERKQTFFGINFVIENQSLSFFDEKQSDQHKFKITFFSKTLKHFFCTLIFSASINFSDE